MNSALLKSIIVKRNMKQLDVSSKLNISYNAFNKKLNGYVPFTLEEVIKLREILSLSLQEIDEIFL